MKKALLLLTLIVILVTALTITPICYAATLTASNSFYEVTNTDGLQTYVKSDDVTFVQSIIIPYSYFFKIIQSPAEGYYKISYNGYEELYVAEATLNQSVRLTTYESASSFSAGPYYTLPLNAPATALTTYNKDFTPNEPNIFKSLSFIGYASHDNEYYFFTKATITIGDVSQDFYVYVKASDVISSSFEPNKISINPDSQPAKKEENDKNVEKAQNQLKRNTYVVVISVVCVLVVILIYNPFKKKTQSRPVNSITTNDDI